MSAPLFGRLWVRWSWQSPWRAVGLDGALYLVKKANVYAVLFGYVHGRIAWVLQILELWMVIYEESSEWTDLWTQALRTVWDWVSSYVDPRKLPVLSVTALKE